MKKKIIEKLELPYDDEKGNFSSGSGEIHILRKVNEIIGVLNQLQKQLDEKPEEKLKEEDMLRWLRNGGVLRIGKEKQAEVKKDSEIFIDNLKRINGKQENYREKLIRHLEKIEHLLQLSAELGISKEIEEFISELLKREKSILQMISDRVFSKEELKVIEELYDGMLYPTNPDEKDKLVHDKLSKLLKEKENE